jgi:hypothetical protein
MQGLMRQSWQQTWQPARESLFMPCFAWQLKTFVESYVGCVLYA